MDLLQLAGALLSSVAVGAGVYAGIKADLARTMEKAQNAHESATEAHQRIDNLILNTQRK